MNLDELYRQFAALKNVDVQWHPLSHRSGGFLFPKIVSREIDAYETILMIGAGVHGNEIAGPISLAKFGQAIIDHAHAKGLGIIFYPLRNPSGYPTKRYNIDCDDKDVISGNNDFLRYVLSNGQVIDDLGAGDEFAEWGWSSDPRFGIQLPAETILMHGLLRQDSLEKIGVVIDLHQDHISENAPPRAYHYAFGDLSAYEFIVRQIGRVVPLWRDQLISAGYAGITAAPEQARRSDENGFIVRHDGTWTDLIFRIGEKQQRRIHCITPETTGATPLDAACAANRIWIDGIIDLL